MIFCENCQIWSFHGVSRNTRAKAEWRWYHSGKDISTKTLVDFVKDQTLQKIIKNIVLECSAPHKLRKQNYCHAKYWIHLSVHLRFMYQVAEFARNATVYDLLLPKNIVFLISAHTWAFENTSITYQKISIFQYFLSWKYSIFLKSNIRKKS